MQNLEGMLTECTTKIAKVAWAAIIFLSCFDLISFSGSF